MVKMCLSSKVIPLTWLFVNILEPKHHVCLLIYVREDIVVWIKWNENERGESLMRIVYVPLSGNVM